MADRIDVAVAELEGVELIVQEVSPQEIQEIGITNVPDEVDHIHFPSDPALAPALGEITRYAAEHNIVISLAFPAHNIPGIFLGYGPSFYNAGAQMATMADKVLQDDIDINELPVGFPEYYLSINLVAAEAAGLDVPNSILRQAEWIVREDGVTQRASD